MIISICNLVDNIICILKMLCQYIKYKIYLIRFNDMVINICQELIKVNYFYVKFLQWGIQDCYNIDSELKEYFKQFSTNVPYTDEDIDFEVLNKIQTRIESTNRELILYNNGVPINSGTVALVFKGKLNETPVAIKLLRKNVHQKIKNGINNVLNLLKIYNYIMAFIYKPNTQLIDIIHNNTELLLEQCFFDKEVENLEFFKKKMEQRKSIVIPEVYKEFTNISNKIIVMVFLEGRIFNNIESSELGLYAETIRMFVFECLFIHHSIHCDLHFGNIILLDDYKIGIIDFGLVIYNSKKFTNCVFSILLAIQNVNIRLLLENLMKILIIDEEDIKKVRPVLYENSALILGSLEHINIKDIITVINLIRFIDVKLNPLLCKNLLSILSCLGMLEKIGERKPIKTLFSDYLKKTQLRI